MLIRTAVAVVLLFPATAFADSLRLHDGTQLEGEVERRGTQVILHFDGGSIAFAAAEVASVTEADTRLADYGQRRANLMPRDVAGRLSLARWAASNGLEARAMQNYREVIRLEPDNAAAHTALGHKKVDGRWLTEDEYKRSQGLVNHLGGWMSPEEADKKKAALHKKAQAITEGRRALAKESRESAEPPKPQVGVDRDAGFTDNPWNQAVYVGGFGRFGQPLVGFGSYVGFGSTIHNNPWIYYGVALGNPQPGYRPQPGFRPRGGHRGRPPRLARPTGQLRGPARLPARAQGALPGR